MSEQIREQVSAFLDGELPNSETELLLKRLTRDGELRESFGRYSVIGEALRGASPILLTRSFTSRVNLAIDGEPIAANGAAQVQHAPSPRWWRPFAGAAVAAGVAVVAVVALQQRADGPLARPGLALTAQNAAAQTAAARSATAQNATAQNAAAVQSATASNAAAQSVLAQDVRAQSGLPATIANLAPAPREAISYTVPAASTTAAAAMPPARLTNYVFAHSRYSSGLDQRGVVADMLIESGEQPAAADEAAAHVAP